VTAFLDEALAEARQRTQRWREERLLESLRAQARRRPTLGQFAAALRGGRPPALIAEIKRASPSQGVFGGDVDAVSRARDYARAGAAAVSVLTESHWFHGSLDDLQAVASAVTVPVLRKDFIVDEYDLEVSAAAGADAVLLIAAAFDSARLAELIAFSAVCGLDALVEIHDARDLTTTRKVDATILGVNARDLRTLRVDLPAALELLATLPGGILRILESGVRSRDDVEVARSAGADAILVGEALMRTANPGETIRQLLGMDPVSDVETADVRSSL